MATILHLLGATCAGKTTLIEKMLALSPGKVGAVQIGKMMRAKYGAAFFKGQAAPASTQHEAMDMYYAGILEGIAEGKSLILVDGQPRDLNQAKTILAAWPQHRSEFLLVHADHDVRESRAKATRKEGDELDLALARLVNDYRNNYVVMTEILRQHRRIDVVDTARIELTSYCQNLIYLYTESRERRIG